MAFPHAIVQVLLTQGSRDHFAISSPGMSLPGALDAFLIALLLLAAGLAVFFLRRRRRDLPGAEPVCGKCGYCVKGLTTFVCPECGSDLREVGIIRSQLNAGVKTQRPWWPAFGWILGWSVAIGCVAVVLTVAVANWVWPVRWTRSVTLDLRAAGDRYRIDVAGVSVQSVWGTARVIESAALPPTTVSVAIRGPKLPPVRLAVDGSGRIVDSQAPGRPATSSVPDLALLQQMMQQAGLEQTDPRCHAEAVSLLDLLQASRQTTLDEAVRRLQLAAQRNGTGWPFSVSSYIDRSLTGMKALYWLSAGGWGAAWLAGIAVILRRHRRRLGALRQTEQTGPVAAKRSGAATRTMTVLFSDIKDFTAYTAGGSRHQVIDLVRRHREVAQPIIRQRGGHIIKSMGDGLLATFDSATEAVLAGLEIQAAAGKPDRPTFDNAGPLELRIAICTGEVVVVPDDIFGEPVNLASRLQQLAEVGEVLLGEATYVTVNRREACCEFAGEYELKGIAGKIRAYRAVSGAIRTAPFPETSDTKGCSR